MEVGLEEHVRFAGTVSDREIGDFYHAGDVFVMANRQLANGDVEGFGLVFLEANACGKPVVGGRSGGAVDAIADGESGLLVAEDEGWPVAFVMFRGAEGCAYVEQLDVLPSHERRGIGAALLDAVAEAARERGWAALTLSTFRDVPFNAPYYRRLGFAEVSELTPGMAQIRREHEARGLDEARRVFMRREV